MAKSKGSPLKDDGIKEQFEKLVTSVNNRKSNLEHIQDFGAINASKSGKEDRYNHEKYYPLIGAISRDHLIMSGVLAWSLDIFTGRIDQKKYQGSNMLESI